MKSKQIRKNKFRH